MACLSSCVFVYWSEVYVGCLLRLLFTLVLEIASLAEAGISLIMRGCLSRAPRICLFQPTQHWDYRVLCHTWLYVAAGFPDSDPHACAASTLSTEPSSPTSTFTLLRQGHI